MTLLGDIKIAASAIIDASDNWCEDWQGSVQFYLRNKKYVTLNEAVTKFGQGRWVKTETGECPTCGCDGYESEERMSNPDVEDEQVERLFTDLDDEPMQLFINQCCELGIAYLDIEMPDDFERDWLYVEPKPADRAMEDLAIGDAGGKQYKVWLIHNGAHIGTTFYATNNQHARQRAHAHYPGCDVQSVDIDTEASEDKADEQQAAVEAEATGYGRYKITFIKENTTTEDETYFYGDSPDEVRRYTNDYYPNCTILTVTRNPWKEDARG